MSLSLSAAGGPQLTLGRDLSASSLAPASGVALYKAQAAKRKSSGDRKKKMKRISTDASDHTTTKSSPPFSHRVIRFVIIVSPDEHTLSTFNWKFLFCMKRLKKNQVDFHNVESVRHALANVVNLVWI